MLSRVCFGSIDPVVTKTAEMLEGSKKMSGALGIASPGDRVVIIAGVPIGIRGTTNPIKVEIVE
jgi:pyruvate kinase